jgi:hypothetical protein
VARAANLGLKAAWFRKWAVHRRLRPEAYAGCVHNRKTGAASYPVHTRILNSQAAHETFNRFGSYLLPMAYPEGSPTHPAYPAGHAVIAGACATVLKAFFKESFVIGLTEADGSKMQVLKGSSPTAWRASAPTARSSSPTPASAFTSPVGARRSRLLRRATA